MDRQNKAMRQCDNFKSDDGKIISHSVGGRYIYRFNQNTGILSGPMPREDLGKFVQEIRGFPEGGRRITLTFPEYIHPERNITFSEVKGMESMPVSDGKYCFYNP